MDLKYYLGTVYFASYLATLMSVLISTAIAIFLLPNRWAAAYLALLWSLVLFPLDRPTSRWGQHFCKLSLQAACKRHNVKVIYEDKAALKPGRPYVIGYEPHSSLPFAMQTVWTDMSPLKPPGLSNIRILVTSAGLYVPFIRHLWWWLGGRSADKATMHRLLDEGCTVALIPGGVQECAHMEPGKEVAFLKARRGFVRIAMQHGAPLVPVFCFGQTGMFSWFRLGPPIVSKANMLKIARKMGFLPMVLHGAWGSTLTHAVPVHMVIGKPIELPKKENPSQQEVQQYLDRFIDALEILFDTYKADAGYGHLKLQII